jgi:hypothetical protein
VETAMNVDNITIKPVEVRPAPTPPEPPVIQLEEIQSIIYLGVRGGVLPAESHHRVDTFA